MIHFQSSTAVVALASHLFKSSIDFTDCGSLLQFLKSIPNWHFLFHRFFLPNWQLRLHLYDLLFWCMYQCSVCIWCFLVCLICMYYCMYLMFWSLVHRFSVCIWCFLVCLIWSLVHFQTSYLTFFLNFCIFISTLCFEQEEEKTMIWYKEHQSWYSSSLTFSYDSLTFCFTYVHYLLFNTWVKFF